MREIEIKVKVNNLEEIKQKLKDLELDIPQPVHQHDEVFTNSEMEKMRAFVRIRKQDDEYIYTFKQDITSQLDCIEYETKITDGEEMRNILLASNYKSFSIVEKNRTKVKLDDYTICLDDVENLGTFVEVEKLVEDMSDTANEEIEKEILNFMKNTLGIDISQRIYKGYDIMQIEKDNQNS